MDAGAIALSAEAASGGPGAIGASGGRRGVPASPAGPALIAGATAETFRRSGAARPVASGSRTDADRLAQPDRVASVIAIEAAGCQ